MKHVPRVFLCTAALVLCACGNPGNGNPDAPASDTATTDAVDSGALRDSNGTADASDVSTPLPDSGGIDATTPDTGTPDSGALDAGTRDGGRPDVTALPDVPRTDTGTPRDGATDVPRPPTDGGLDPGPGPTRMCAFTPDTQGFFRLVSPRSDYWVRLPPGYNPATAAPLPLLVSAHGCGDTARNHATWAVVPFALRATQNYIGISLGGREGACWTIGTDSELLMAAIADVRSCFYVHQKKIFVSGYSSGGMLAYSVGMRNAAMFAGILIENSGLSQAVGGSNVATVLAAAAWRINVAHTARISDGSFAIAGVRADRDRIMAAGFNMDYRELAGTHDGTSDDWSMFLIPHMAGWNAP